MNLRTVKIDKEFLHMAELEALNTEAFPLEERIEVSEILEMTRHGEVDFKAVYDGESFIAFYLVFKKAPCVYIYFLTVNTHLRRRGYGGKVLELMSREYEDFQIILDLEEIDGKAKNNAQRLTRKKFYLRNGYKEAGYGMAYVGMRFEVLFRGEEIRIEAFKELIEQTREIINAYSSNKFEPDIYLLDK